MFTPLENLKEIPKSNIKKRKRFHGSDFLAGFKKLILSIIKFYQKFLSPDQGIFNLSPGSKKNCRFYPSCSGYTYQAIEKYGTRKGLWFGIKRILKCHPWHSGGVDLP